MQPWARFHGVKADLFSTFEELASYRNRVLYNILEPVLHGLLCEGHRCSTDGEVRVDPEVIANASGEHTCAKHYPSQFLHNFVKWQLYSICFMFEGAEGLRGEVPPP